MEHLEYKYRNLPIPGGGYVTGFVFHEKQADVLYLRTDIGGVYRFDYKENRWNCLTDYVNMDDIRETFPAAIALDPGDPERVYITSGIYQNPVGLLTVSKDGGKTFEKIDLPFMVHGNLNGRGTGNRLIVDPENRSCLYYASQEDGLWRSIKEGKDWEKLNALPENHLTFVAVTKDGNALVVGSAGVTIKRGENLRGKGLYVSYDKGETFENLWQPEDGAVPGIRLAGLVPQRYAEDDSYFYVTFSVMGYNAYVLENGYSCDGGSVVGGKVVRYPKTADGTLGQGEDITPNHLRHYVDENGLLEFGFGGISCAATRKGFLTVSSVCKEDGDCIWRSYDYGTTWECILHDLSIGKMDFRTSYMRPEYNGGHNLIHWLTDIKVNPFNENELWFNTGTGVFRTQNLHDKEVVFQDWCDGLEETVHLNLYSPPAGEVKLIDILGDLGGFAFRELDKTPDNSFADDEGNRYITCLNADYSDLNPSLVLVTPRGNWKGKTKGGLILSKDQCKTFERLPMPFGLSPRIDEMLRRIEQPNVNSGWAALSQEGNRIVWTLAQWCDLPVEAVLVSQDAGKSFRKACIYDKEGNCISEEKCTGANGISENSTGEENCPDEENSASKANSEKEENNVSKEFSGKLFKPFADRVDNDIFYGFGETGQFYVSRDGGLTFREKEFPEDFPKLQMGLLDCANHTEIRPENGKSGVFYMALGEEGLWKLSYDKEKDQVCADRLSKAGDIFYRVGLGVGREGGDYLSESKMIFTAAKIDGIYGFYRSADDGKSFCRINDEKQMFGDINSIEGDSQVFGRFYIGSGSRGVLYGEPKQ